MYGKKVKWLMILLLLLSSLYFLCLGTLGFGLLYSALYETPRELSDITYRAVLTIMELGGIAGLIALWTSLFISLKDKSRTIKVAIKTGCILGFVAAGTWLIVCLWAYQSVPDWLWGCLFLLPTFWMGWKVLSDV